MALERELLGRYLQKRNLKQSRQRSRILEVLLENKKHMTADELYSAVSRRYAGIGQATVYRALNLLCDSGICAEMKLEDGVTRYEIKAGHEHHDHLICIKCGKFIEVVDSRIEGLQSKLAKKHGFKQTHHKLEIYGICRRCRG